MTARKITLDVDLVDACHGNGNFALDRADEILDELGLAFRDDEELSPGNRLIRKKLLDVRAEVGEARAYFSGCPATSSELES